MNQEADWKLFYIRLFHSIIWLLYTIVILYILYSGVFNRVTIYTWLGIGMVVVEAVILFLYKWSCPLSSIARRYTDSTKDNFDIFLPNWLAKNNKTIYTTLFLLGIILIFIRSTT